MKIHIKIFKGILTILFAIIKKSKDSVTYIFEVLLKDELKSYLETKYYRGYVHIEKVISLAKSLHLEEQTILDVGGSNGYTASLFSKAFPESKVYAFEPIEESYNKIRLVSGQYPNIIPVRTALGNFRGETKINIAESISSSSILNLNADEKSDEFGRILKSTGAEIINVDLLDNLIPSGQEVSILKIDVQGYELEVLKGGRKTLSKTRFVVLEISNHGGYVNSPKYHEIDEFLRNESFCIYDIFPSIHDNMQLIEWDVIYKRPDQQ
jgi:FkbM family methyltransferase